MPEPGKAPRKQWLVAVGDVVRLRNSLVLYKEICIIDGTFLPPWLAVLWIFFQADRRNKIGN
jgi:hypothetical protein